MFIGVEFIHEGLSRKFRAIREVMFSTAAIVSPQLRQSSGIGDATLLSKHQIPAVRHLPGLGANLQDDLQIRSVLQGARCVHPDHEGVYHIR